jgi:hypothetical protein
VTVGRDFVEVELAEMIAVRAAGTASRSVLGVMNEFEFLAEVESQFVGEHDLLSLSLRSTETPCGLLFKRHISPDSVEFLLGGGMPRGPLGCVGSSDRSDVLRIVHAELAERFDEGVGIRLRAAAWVVTAQA